MSWQLGADPLGNPIFTADDGPTASGEAAASTTYADVLRSLGADAAAQPAGATGCPTGYGTIYKYDGTTECIDPATPNIAAVIAAKTQGGIVDRATIGLADTLKTGVDAVKGAGSELGALANPFGSWTAALVWVAVLGFGVYALGRLTGPIR